MKCKDANNEILIAELDALAGLGSSELAEHVRACADCRAAAQSVLAGMAAAKSLRAERARSRRSPARFALVAALPIAAAIVWAVVRRDHTPSVPAAVRASADRAEPEPHVSVDLPPGRSAIVMKTADPRVTVVWLSPGVGQ